MIDVENNIDVFIPEQVPLFYNIEGPDFVEFIKQYYIWLQSTGKPIQKARDLLLYGDLDTSTDPYLQQIQNKYLQNIPITDSAARIRLLKNALDLYRNKGNLRSFDILFRALYDIDTEMYIPGQDMLRLSDGIWLEPEYLEVSYVSNLSTYVDNEIIGLGSQARAIVELYNREIVNSKTIEILKLSNVRGKFNRGEFIRKYGTTQTENLPKILGSLTAISVIDGGSQFAVGDVVDVRGFKGGTNAKAKVSSIKSQDGRVSFQLTVPGSGYTLQTIPVVRAKTILSVGPGNTNIQPGQIIQQSSGATGTVVTSNNTTIVIKESVGGFTVGQNVYSSTILTVYKNDNNANAFTVGEVITQFSGATQIANGTIIQIQKSNTELVVGNVHGEFAYSYYSNTGLANNYFRSNTSLVNGFIYDVSTGGNTGYATITDIIGSGSGASVRIGSLFGTEVLTLNTDYVRDLLTTKLTTFSGAQTGTVSVLSGGANIEGVSTLFASILANNMYVQIDSGANKEVVQLNVVANDIFANITTTFSTAHTGVQYFSDISNYGFAAFTLPLNQENLSTIIGVALTEEDVEVGSIKALTSINPGSGYALNPYVDVTNQQVSDRSIPDIVYGGIKGNNAVINATAGFSNGIASAVNVIDSGFAFEPGEFVTMTLASNTDLSITGRALVINQGRSLGFWKDTRGFLSSNKYIQDSRYYQEYSYEIRNELSYRKYIDVINTVIHPVGLASFGRVSISQQTGANTTIIVEEHEYPANGTVTVTSTSNTVVGEGTFFTTTFSNSDLIKIDNYSRVITNIANNTSLSILTAFPKNYTSNVYSKIIVG